MSREIWFSISKLTCANLEESEDDFLEIKTFLQMKEAYLSIEAELRRCFGPFFVCFTSCTFSVCGTFCQRQR
jgi:hypothetical protein